MPFTPVAPPANELMLSQPARSGSQLTDGRVTAPFWDCAGTCRCMNGIACSLACEAAT